LLDASDGCRKTRLSAPGVIPLWDEVGEGYCACLWGWQGRAVHAVGPRRRRSNPHMEEFKIELRYGSDGLSIQSGSAIRRMRSIW